MVPSHVCHLCGVICIVAGRSKQENTGQVLLWIWLWLPLTELYCASPSFVSLPPPALRAHESIQVSRMSPKKKAKWHEWWKLTPFSCALLSFSLCCWDASWEKRNVPAINSTGVCGTNWRLQCCEWSSGGTAVLLTHRQTSVSRPIFSNFPSSQR